MGIPDLWLTGWLEIPSAQRKGALQVFGLDLLAFLGAGSQLEREVVGDGFAFAVRVRRQEDFVCLGGQLLELVDDFFFAGRDHQLGLERAMLEFDANVVLRQVHDVAD